MTDINQTESKFEILYGGKKAGVLNFLKKDSSTIEIIHTEVQGEFAGKGMGKELVKAAVEYARKNDFKMIPTCTFARKIIESTPELQDILA
jgi:predicted GNAT family acetyltransferase